MSDEVVQSTVIQTTYRLGESEITVVIDQDENSITALCTLREDGKVVKFDLTRDEITRLAKLFGEVNKSLMPKIAELTT